MGGDEKGERDVTAERLNGHWHIGADTQTAKRERERVVWRALVAPHSLYQILWCVDSSLRHGTMSV